jgi:hypothetical protein
VANSADAFYTIPAARATVNRRTGLLLMVKGSLRQHAAALDSFFDCLSLTQLARWLRYSRRLNETGWSGLPARGRFGETFDFPPDQGGPWGLELAEHSGADAALDEGARLELLDLDSSVGGERASYIRLIFREPAPSAEIATLAQWLVHNFPIWWGTAGWFFHHTAGSRYAATMRIAALAKRYWCVQIQELGSLQWLAPQGLPSIAWITLIGREFAQSKGVELEALEADFASAGSDIFSRRGQRGVAFALGSRPLHGDINVGEPVRAYGRVAAALQPLMLPALEPLAGALGKPAVLKAWQQRFTAPASWLECDVSD